MKGTVRWACFRRPLCVGVSAGGLLAIMVLLAACQSATPGSTAPTLTLIPVTRTSTPLPADPSPTPMPPAPDNALLASTLLASTPTLSSSNDEGGLIEGLNPVAAELVLIAQRQVAAALDLPQRRVRLVDITPYRWTDSSLGCPLAGQTYVPVLSDGYRIVLSVGDTVFYFHTDFDRVMPCEIGLERLPEGTPQPTIIPSPTVPQVG